MHLLRWKLTACACAALLLISTAPAQEQTGDKVDLATLTQLKREAFQHSQVMENLYYMSEVYGPRVSNEAATIARGGRVGHAADGKLPGDCRTSTWRSKGTVPALWMADQEVLRRVGDSGLRCADWLAAGVDAGDQWPGDGGCRATLLCTPREDFAKYRGQLKGKIVLIFDPRELAMHTEPDAHRLTDAEIEERTKTPDPSRTGFGGPRPGVAAPRPGEFTPSSLSTAAPSGRILRNKVNAFLKEEGVAVARTPGYNGDGGTIFASYGGSQDPKDPVGPPMQAASITLRNSTTASAACCSMATPRS